MISHWITVVCVALCAGPSEQASTAQPVGRRPYEMEWANRTRDTRPPLVDFENLEGWTVECHDAEAQWSRSREQQIWGRYVGKLVYRRTGPQPSILIRPPKPIAVSAPIDCVNLWVYGNNWAWAPDRSTPQVDIAVLLRGANNHQVRVSLGRVRWKEWFVMHRRLSREQLVLLGNTVMLEGIEVLRGRNKEPRTLFFDNLALYKEQLPPLEFAPRPRRNLTLPAGQSTGTNTGPGVLPFPTREETILPDNLTNRFTTSVTEGNHVWEFHYRGDDGHLVYRYKPSSGLLSDVTACWNGGKVFQPLDGGGVYFWTDNGAAAPERTELVSCRLGDNAVTATWMYQLGPRRAEVTYTFRLWQKSLVIDVKCPGGQAGEVRFGRARGVENPRLVTLPYLTCASQRPAVLVCGPPEQPLFLMGLVDYYRSNASELWAAGEVGSGTATYNGGSRYLPRTDGQRNDCFERLFLTIAPRFEEVLPNVANPKSPWMHVAGERLWRAHGASNRQRDLELWRRVARYGMTKVVITDHETGWRDGGESFTLRTRAAPGKGGDEGQREYARKIRALGFRYGIYNNYTDFAPVNEHWDEDYVTRLSNGDWRPAWARCYNLKPARAVELEATLAPIIQEKFHLDTAYCDVHTAVRPWQYCDYDARVPSAATFAATFYAYGEIMLHQKATWNGPVYSEGNNHWYYCGLTDGNYGQDQLARLNVNPWLVDFDLRKLHPLCCNFGMGNLGMFFGRKTGLGNTPEQQQARLDRFLAATLAFGHTGFLVLEGGMENAVRSYFSVQQVHAHYAQETAAEIRYADADGHLLHSSAAVATGAYKRSQVAVRYSNGLLVVVNGHRTDTWQLEKSGLPNVVLPPNGWYATGDLPDGKLLAYSALVDEHRVDYVDSPEYVYANGRGRFTRFPKVACDGQLVVLRRAGNSVEVIPVGRCTRFGVGLEGHTATAVALDEEGNQLGPAEVRFSRGLVWVMPRQEAFSYLLTPGPVPKVSLHCDRREVIPGEKVIVVGTKEYSFDVPSDAVPGEHLWQQFEGTWIDFLVVPLVEASLSLDASAQQLQLRLVPHLAAASQAEVKLAGQSRRVRLVPGRAHQIAFPFERPREETVRELPLTITAGALRYENRWYLKAEQQVVPIGELAHRFQAMQCLRGGEEKPLDGVTRAAVYWRDVTCGEVTKPALFMHPPYVGNVGYVAAVFDALDLPTNMPAAFRCLVGKADGSDPGDGILYRVLVLGPDGSETPVAEKQWTRHAWTPLEADLSPWAGHTVQLKLVADVGPANNSSGDWSCWAEMRVESLRRELALSLHSSKPILQHVPGPLSAPAPLSAETIRAARGGVLHFQAIGLQCGEPYISFATLNGVSLGKLPAAGGNEKAGTWAEAAVPLPKEAIGALSRWNTLRIDNPGRDCFKLRRLWIELTLADGSRIASDVAQTTVTQPPEWLHAEGRRVPFGEPIEIEIRFGTLPEDSPPMSVRTASGECPAD